MPENGSADAPSPRLTQLLKTIETELQGIVAETVQPVSDELQKTKENLDQVTSERDQLKQTTDSGSTEIAQIKTELDQQTKIAQDLQTENQTLRSQVEELQKTQTPDMRELAAKSAEQRQAQKQENLDQILALVKEKGEISNQEVQLALRVSESTSLLYLNELVEQGKLVRKDNGPQTTYTLPS